MRAFIRLFVVCLLITLVGTERAAGQSVSHIFETPTVAPPAPGAPLLVPVRGHLRTVAGEPRTGTAWLRIALYAGHNDVDAIWTEDQQVTLGPTGLYDVLFGITQPQGLPVDLFVTGAGKWIGVTPAGDVEQLRTQLVALPYAGRAAVADTLEGRKATDFVLAENLKERIRAVLQGSDLQSTSSTSAPSEMTLSSTELSTLTMSTTPNTVAKYLDSAGTLGESTITETGGLVGLSTTSPGARLDVNGAMRTRTGNIQLHDGANFGGGIFFHKTITGAGSSLAPSLFSETSLHFMTGGSVAARMLLDATGRLGIGTADPATALDVNGAIRSRTGNFQLHDGTLFSGGFFFHKTITGSGNSIDPAFFAEGGIHFMAGGAPTTRLYVDPSGRLGVGTTAPEEQLHVVGNLKVTGNLAARYQDVAEWVDAVEPLTAATVVAADSQSANRVRASSRAYDTAVLGVVSARPGLILGEAGDGKVAVAQSGRVKVKVDARYGAIKPGDLLVTSPITGYAMRSRPTRGGFHRPGTIIGKALEALPRGKGEILVLVTLQ